MSKIVERNLARETRAAPQQEIIFCDEQKKIKRTLKAGEYLQLFLLMTREFDMKTECVISLDGEAARIEVFAILLAGAEQKISLSCETIIRGENTKADIIARSIVAGTGQKNLVSTLNFISGASGASGHEEETVLLLGKNAINESTPIILCGESQVEGSHALNSGNIDAAALFYLMTRGFNELAARRVLAQAAVADVAEKMLDEDLRTEVFERINKILKGEKNA